MMIERWLGLLLRREKIRAGSSLLLLWEVRKVRGEGVRPGKVRKDSGSEFNGVRP
jgi:hypothetical protein